MQKPNWNEFERMGKKWGGRLSRKRSVFYFIHFKNGARPACLYAVRNIFEGKIKNGKGGHLLNS